MSNDIVIAVDAMGGDHGPSVVVSGAVDAARETGVSLALVGDESSVYAELEKLNCSDLSVKVVHAAQVAEMQDKPSDVLRRKKDASIQVACRLVREGSAHGLVSPGHSGATVACGMFVVGRVEGVDRPALASFMPTENDPMVLLDVGATVDCKPHNLFQFGLMGDAVAKALLGIEKPGIGLLSIGEEEGKGNTQVKEAYELFKMAQNINFLGNAEGRDIFTGQVDVVVCDGFVGNVVLKQAEAFYHILTKVNPDNKFNERFNSENYGGTPVLGVNKPVIIAHGASSPKAIMNMIIQTREVISSDLCEKFKQAFR